MTLHQMVSGTFAPPIPSSAAAPRPARGWEPGVQPSCCLLKVAKSGRRSQRLFWESAGRGGAWQGTGQSRGWQFQPQGRAGLWLAGPALPPSALLALSPRKGDPAVPTTGPPFRGLCLSWVKDRWPEPGPTRRRMACRPGSGRRGGGSPEKAAPSPTHASQKPRRRALSGQSGV